MMTWINGKVKLLYLRVTILLMQIIKLGMIITKPWIVMPSTFVVAITLNFFLLPSKLYLITATVWYYLDSWQRN